MKSRPLSSWSRQRESNPQPTVYKTVALPLSHAGVFVHDSGSMERREARSSRPPCRLSLFTACRVNSGFASGHTRQFARFWGMVPRAFAKGAAPESMGAFWGKSFMSYGQNAALHQVVGINAYTKPHNAWKSIKVVAQNRGVEKRGRMASPSRGEKDRVAASRARGARASRAPPGRCGPRGACAVSGARRWPDGTQRPARPCWSRARRSRRASRGCRPPWP